MASVGQPDFEPEPQPDLRKFSKIISCSTNGQLRLHEGNLKMILNSMEQCQKNLPVAFISIIGPTGSGKSFYTNLLINYFNNECAGNWLTKLSSVHNREDNVLEFLEGFSFGNVHAYYENVTPDEDVSGVYLWPEPFRMQNYGGKIVVWILHVHYCRKNGDNVTATKSINSLLALLCSRITEIKFKNDQQVITMNIMYLMA